MRKLLVTLLLCPPASAAPTDWDIPTAYRRTLSGLGLPVFSLPEAAAASHQFTEMHFSKASKGYKLTYWTAGDDQNHDIIIRCVEQAKAPQNDGKSLESQPLKAAGPLGAVTVHRLKASCRTDWIRRGNAWVLVSQETQNLAQFGQLLERLQVKPGKARTGVEQEALQLTGITPYRLQGMDSSRTEVALNPSREFHHYTVFYPVPGGTLEQHAALGGVGSIIVDTRRSPLREEKVSVAGLKFDATMARERDGKTTRCFTQWATLPRGFLHFSIRSSNFEQFLGWVRQTKKI